MKHLPTYFVRGFDNSPRCCWGDPDATCQVHEEEPKRTGAPEWLRFIHNVGSILQKENNPFLTDGPFRLLMETDGHTTVNDERLYCETYLRVTPDSIKPVVRVFLDNETGFAVIELYEAGYEGTFRAAYDMTQGEYLG